MSYLCVVKNLKLILPLLLIAIVLGGNVGIRECIHMCSEKGISRSFVFHQEDNCAKEHADPCCEEDNSSEDDCCTEEENFYQVHFEDFRHHEPVTDFQAAIITFPKLYIIESGCSLALSSEDQTFLKNASPPLSGMDRCIRNCTYLI